MGVQFDIALHNQFNTDHGQILQYLQHSLCPCNINPYLQDASRPLLSCKVCNGVGYVYASPVNITGLITGIRNQKDLVDIGIIQPGDLLLGLPPGAPQFLSDYDIIRIPNLPLAFNGYVNVRSNGTLPVTDTLPYPVVNTYRVFSGNPSTGQIFDYTQNVDFTVNGRSITWNNTTNVSTNLPAGAPYSFDGSVIFDWVVFVAPTERMDGPYTNIGQRAVLRKRHIVFPKSVQ